MRYQLLGFLVLIGFNIFVWHKVITGAQENLDLYFLNVGQGDSQLVVLPGDVKILIDGGPNKSALPELAKAIPSTKRYIDLVVMTHPQTDHFAGLYDVIERYRVGAFIANGREGKGETWDNFRNLLEEKQIPVILVQAGDKIFYKDSRFGVLSPDKELLKDREINESSIILKLESEGIKALFTGDAGFKTENYLLSTSQVDNLNVDVLKVGHHGSRYSTGFNFLSRITPAISVIEVGRNNYGHPSEATIKRLNQIGSRIYRTDNDKTIKIEVKDGRAAVFTGF